MPRKSPRKSSTPHRRASRKSKRHPSKACRTGNRVHNVPVSTLQDIRKLQNSTNLCIPRLPFTRVIREILMEHTAVDMKVERKALDALQEAAEMYLTQLFEDCYYCTLHGNRVTLKPSDIKLTLFIRGILDPGYHLI